MGSRGLLVTAVRVREQARHIPATRALIRDQSWLSCQRLDADHFIASGTATLTSTDGPTKSATMRFTDVYERQADGRWLIVNEHVSMKPEEKKA